MIRALDVHAHISTAQWQRSTKKFSDAMKVYYKTEQQVRTEAEMAQDFIAAGVKGCIIAWDAEAGTGEPRTPNDYIASPAPPTTTSPSRSGSIPRPTRAAGPWWTPGRARWPSRRSSGA